MSDLASALRECSTAIPLASADAFFAGHESSQTMKRYVVRMLDARGIEFETPDGDRH